MTSTISSASAQVEAPVSAKLRTHLHQRRHGDSGRAPCCAEP
jgi:hypothetical protein